MRGDLRAVDDERRIERALEEIEDVLRCGDCHPTRAGLRKAGIVRGHHNPLVGEQRRIRARRLVLEHVQAGSGNAPLVERRNKRMQSLA